MRRRQWRTSLSVTWLKDGQADLPSTNNNGQYSSATTSVRLINEFAALLTVESLTGHLSTYAADSYVCRVANQGGQVEAFVHVVVQCDDSRPSFPVRPSPSKKKICDDDIQRISRMTTGQYHGFSCSLK